MFGINSVLLSFALIIFPGLSSAATEDCVILLHGLTRTKYSMQNLAYTLRKQHYLVVNESYPSRSNTINTLAETYISPMVDKCLQQHPKHIHFVTHSLGGIIVQQYLQHHKIKRLASIVMLGPPNHGSPLADFLHQTCGKSYLLGRPLQELTTQRQDIPMQPGHYKIGIIAGSFNVNPLGKFIFHEPNDGKVGVSSTKLKHMDDFIVLPVAHTFMMGSETVKAQIIHFLNHGCFEHNMYAYIPGLYIA